MKSKNLKRYIKNFLFFFSAAIGVTNILAVWWFWNWVKKVEIQGVINFDFSQYLTIQAYQNSLLQVFLVIFGLGSGLLGVYGFSQIKTSAEDDARETAKEVAEKKAEEVAKKIVEDFLKSQNPLELGKPSFPYSNKEDGKGGHDA